MPLAREDGCRRALRGRLKEGIRKVASEPEDSKPGTDHGR